MFRKLTFSSSALLALAVSSLAPAAAEETHHLWPRFTIDAGAYQVSTSDKIKVAGEIELLGRPSTSRRTSGCRTPSRCSA